MKGHSKTNGEQMRALEREVRALRRQLEKPQGRSAGPALQERIDSAVALADQTLGASPSSPLLGPLRKTGDKGQTIRDIAAPFGLPYGAMSPAAEPPQEPGKPPEWMEQGTASFAVPGTPILSGFVTDIQEYNPDLQARNAIQVYEKMRRGDGQVEATLQAMILPILAAEWKVEATEEQIPLPPGRDRNDKNKRASTGAGKATAAKAKEIAEFVELNLFGGLEFRNATGGWATQSWQEVVRNALLMLTFGVSAHEDVYTLDGDKIRLRLLADLLPITFYRFHVDPDDGRTLLYLGQYGYRGARFEQVSVPADKLTVFVFRKEAANFWGRSLLRACYPHWYMKNQLYKIDAIAAERNGMGVPAITLPPGFSKEDHDTAVTFVTQLAAHERTGIVLPNGALFDLVGVKGTVRDIRPSIDHHNEQITVAALENFMNLGRTRTGSRALGTEQTKFFMLALQSTANQVAELITNTTIRRLVAFNFGEDAPCPKLAAANVQARALEDIIDAIAKLAQAGAFVSDRPVRDDIRGQLGLEEETDIGIVSIKGETVTEGADSGAVAGKSAGGVEAAAGKGKTAEPAEEQKAGGKGQKAEPSDENASELSGVLADESGDWITINGVHVLIGPSGHIIKGPANMVGKTKERLTHPVPVTADAVAEKLKAAGYDVRVSHSPSAASIGASSYIKFRPDSWNEIDPDHLEPGLQVRISHHEHNAPSNEIGSFDPSRHSADSITEKAIEHAKTHGFPRSPIGIGRKLPRFSEGADDRTEMNAAAQTHRDSGRSRSESVSQQPGRFAAGTGPEDKGGKAIVGDQGEFVNDRGERLRDGPPGRRRPRKRDQASPYWHEPVAASELHVNFSELDREFTRGESAVGQALKRAKPRLVRKAAAITAEALRAERKPNEITFGHDEKLHGEVLKELERTYRFGAKQVREERDRAKKADSSPAARDRNDSALLAETPEDAKKQLDLVAEGVVQDVTTDVGNAARKAAIDFARAMAGGEDIPPEELEDRLYNAISDVAYVDRGIEKSAAEASRQAMAGGRNDQLEEYDAELQSEGGHYERSELLDQNTCAPCAAGDGQTWESLEEADWSPGDDCEGGDLCRGALIAVYA